MVPAAACIAARPLLRPREGRQLGGVCLAMARSYGWDVALVRIFTVFALFFSGGLVAVAYLAGWIGIPAEPAPWPPG
ncbi:MAG: PspC domain-containing protein [Terracidiphilus sp.]